MGPPRTLRERSLTLPWYRRRSQVFTWLTNPANAARELEIDSSQVLFDAARLAAQAGNQVAAVDLLLLWRRKQRLDEGIAAVEETQEALEHVTTACPAARTSPV